MPVDENALMAAVNQGISDAAPSAPSPTPATTPETPDVAASPETEEDAGADGIPAVEAGSGSGAVPAQADDAEQGDDTPDGEVVSDGGDTPADGKVGKPADLAAKPPVVAEPQKEPDPINDPLPNALKKETKERIHRLIEMTKDGQQAKADRDQLVGMITATGANPAQFNQALDYLRMVNSTSRADREKALETMQAEIAVLARSLGKPVPGVNMLEGHDDLIQEVGQGRLSPERASEIAAARERAKLEVRGSQQHSEQQQRQQAVQQAVAQGRADLNALEASLSSDPAYASKRAILVETLRPVFNQIHPTQWAATFKAAYDKLPAPVAPRPTATPLTASTPANGGGNTPLRASNPAGGTRAAPKSLQEAIDFGINDARG